MPQPWLSRRVVYPLHERLLKRPTFAYLESLEQSQWLSRAALERLQTQKLTELVQTAAGPGHGTPSVFAQRASTSERVVRWSLDDLRRLPIMTKQDAGQCRSHTLG
jgi:phenylacetate-CoA ligase